MAIRENDFRAEALGYRAWWSIRTWSNVLASVFATLAGACSALWLRYNGPDTSLSFEIMLDILLMVVIGGMGTMYGAIIGAALFVVAQSYLQDLLKLAQGRGRGRAGGVGAGEPGPLALLAGALVRAVGLLLSGRHRRPPGGEAMMPASRYVTVLDRELHYVEWGAARADRGDVARPGAHRARLRRHRRRAVRALSRAVPDTSGAACRNGAPDPDREYCLDFVRLAAAFCDATGVARHPAPRWAAPSACAPGDARRRVDGGRIVSLVLNDDIG